MPEHFEMLRIKRLCIKEMLLEEGERKGSFLSNDSYQGHFKFILIIVNSNCHLLGVKNMALKNKKL